MTEWNDNYPAQPQPGARRGRAWPWILLAVGLVLVACTAVAVASALLQETKDPGWTVGAASPTASTPASAPSAGSPAAAAGPATKIEEGTYEVGPEVAPGKYKSAGAKPSAFQLCAWTVKGSDGKVIDLGTANGEAEQQLVTLKAGQVFESSGCHTWTKVG